ncbi:MAG: acyltransferase family protein, partial [Planctomycetota bacterium]
MSAAVAERLHALDALRAVAMLLGVWLHAAIPYVEGVPPGFWAVTGKEPSALAGLSVLLIHSCRMQVFFLVSGFFTAMLVARRGAGGMLRNRALRIGLPFVLAMLTIQPICAVVWGVGYASQSGEPFARV